MNAISGSTHIVSSSFDVQGIGAGVLFVGDPSPCIPVAAYIIEIKTPDGARREAVATSEYARKIPPGEVQALLIRSISATEIPQGSTVTILGRHE
jgi:hypothetical protein